jgi:hypothetical protein
MDVSVNDLEQHKENLKRYVERRDALVKLLKNREFKQIISEGFMRDEVVRSVAMSGDPNFDAKQQADCLSMAQAGGHLKRYLNLSLAEGQRAQDALPELDSAIEEARVDEDGE